MPSLYPFLVLLVLPCVLAGPSPSLRFSVLCVASGHKCTSSLARRSASCKSGVYVPAQRDACIRDACNYCYAGHHYKTQRVCSSWGIRHWCYAGKMPTATGRPEGLPSIAERKRVGVASARKPPQKGGKGGGGRKGNKPEKGKTRGRPGRGKKAGKPSRAKKVPGPEMTAGSVEDEVPGADSILEEAVETPEAETSMQEETSIQDLQAQADQKNPKPAVTKGNSTAGTVKETAKPSTLPQTPKPSTPKIEMVMEGEEVKKPQADTEVQRGKPWEPAGGAEKKANTQSAPKPGTTPGNQTAAGGGSQTQTETPASTAGDAEADPGTVVLCMGNVSVGSYWTRHNGGLTWRKDEADTRDPPGEGEICKSFAVPLEGVYVVTAVTAAPHRVDNNDMYIKLMSGLRMLNPRTGKFSGGGVDYMKAYQNEGGNARVGVLWGVDRNPHVFVSAKLARAKKHTLCVSGRSSKFTVFKVVLVKCEGEACGMTNEVRRKVAKVMDGNCKKDYMN